MDDPIHRKIADSQSGFEKLVARIPGYRGYKEKELRREADKLLRTQLANRFDEARRHLLGAMEQLTSAMRLKETAALQRANMKLQLLIDRLRTATYGYAGLFDAVKVEQEELDRLYAFDSALASGVERVNEIVSTIVGQAAGGESTVAEANALLNVLEELNDTFTRRSEAITGA
jgi:hypothetical protein